MGSRGWKGQTARSTLDWPQGYYRDVVCEISHEMARIKRQREQYKRIRRAEWRAAREDDK